ncbi:flagellin [Brevundimonas nasdae]|nr:flagellin [Brevundimonas nasdae]
MLKVEAALTLAVSAASYFGVQQANIDRLLNHAVKHQDALEMGLGNLVDADMAKESAKLQAAQIRQQLAVQTLSIANNQPQWLLNLFKS